MNFRLKPVILLILQQIKRILRLLKSLNGELPNNYPLFPDSGSTGSMIIVDFIGPNICSRAEGGGG